MKAFSRLVVFLCGWAVILPIIAVSALAETIWIEGEKPTVDKMHRHPWWYDQVKKEHLSCGDMISNFDAKNGGEAAYEFQAVKAGDFDLWFHANPVQSSLAWRLNEGAETELNFFGDLRDNMNIAADGKPDLRFIAWIKAGRVSLKQGKNVLAVFMSGPQSNHGMLDCFVLSDEPFTPNGILKPGQKAAADGLPTGAGKGWVDFDPAADAFAESPIDLRFLNEKEAGDGGFIEAKEGHFVHSKTGKPLRFWAVNGPSHDMKNRAQLAALAKWLAKHGVNMIRYHGAMFDAKGDTDTNAILTAHSVVREMKAEGIYTHFSIYFPLWMQPKADNPWLAGYDGKKNPFAALMFNPEFIKKYQSWWTGLLLTPDEKTGRALIDEPAVAAVEIQNEDSFFFWTFNSDNIPDPQMRILEKQFGDWAAKKYGSVASALDRWGDVKAVRDNPAQGRLGFRPLWNLFSEKKLRDRDTARFLYDTQTGFYQGACLFLRSLGFKGLITPSNWTTASAEILGPIERLSYMPGDFTDRHGYFGCNHKGPNAEWSIREGHTYSDRSAFRFDAEEPGKPRQFSHPAMDIHYNNKPSMISEITWNRPNRFRTESPVYLAAYGALQDSDGIVQFAFDAGRWSVKPGFFMQPWTLASPTMLGQFPATALIYRKGLIKTGAVVADVRLNKDDVLNLKGTPLPQEASLDELRLKDVPTGASVNPGQRLSPMLHFVGKTCIAFSDDTTQVRTVDLEPFVNLKDRTIASSTRELKLNYDQGVLTLNASQAQGLSGCVAMPGSVDLGDVKIASGMELGSILVVSMDDRPLATSKKMLLQVMSEERASGFEAESIGKDSWRIKNIGHEPWQIKELSGTVAFKRADADRLKVTPLDANGYPKTPIGSASEIKLQPQTIYYLIVPQ
jgi:hypothetical protein